MSMDQDFESIYQKIYDSSVARLEEVKSKNKKFLEIFVLCLIIVNLIFYIIPTTRFLSILLACLSICILVAFIAIGRHSYVKAYKQCVIDGLVKAYNSNLYYDATLGISEFDYRASNFDNDFNEFTSEDRIHGRFDSGDAIQLAEVTTFKVTHRVNDQGQEVEDRVETFRGMYGVVYLNKNSMMNIGIYGDSKMRRFRRDRIEMDSSEFEQYYDLVTDDKIRAMRVFTSDLLEKFIDVKKAHKNGVELKVEWDKIYFRFRCGEIFEPPAFVNGLKKEYLKTFYNYIYYPLELLDKTVECLNEVHE